MDWTGIGLAALGGGVGGGLGVGLGMVVARMMPVRGRTLQVALTAGLAVLGMQLVPAALDALTGHSAAVRAREAQSLDDSLLRDMAENPFFAALQRVAPERADAWRAQVVDAYREGGAGAARMAALRAGEEAGAWIAGYYAPRASDAALTHFYTEMERLVSGPMQAYPRACHAYLFATGAGASQAYDAAALGIDMAPVAEAIAGLTDGAAADPRPYDRETARAIETAAADRAAAAIGADNLDLLGAREPLTDAEYALACEGMGIYLRTVLEADYAVEALRDFAAGAG